MNEFWNMNPKKILLAAVIVSLVGPGQTIVHAQENNSRMLEEIVVTAQKREQNLQDVPVAVSVLSADDLVNLDVKSFEDVGRVTPSLSIETGEAPSGNTIRMRGIGTSAFSISAEPSVSVVVDGVPLMVVAQAFGNLEDIARIEVLKGPQGTLFGKNASAGVVSIVTEDPTEEFTTKVGLRATDDDEVRGNISLSGPISDTLGFRLNAYAIDRDGYITNTLNGNDLNGEESHGVRGKLTWQASDALDVNFILDSSSRDSSSVGTYIALPANDPGREMITAGPDNLDVQLDSPVGYETDNEMGVLKIDYDLGNVVLTSVSSYQKYTQDDVIDTDSSSDPIPQDPFLNPTGAPPGTPFIEQRSRRESTAFSQEVRLASNTDGAFEYMVGAWYQDVEHERDFDRCCFRFLLSDWEAEATNESTAVFGQLTWQFSENTFLDTGLRFNHEDVSVDFTNYLITPPLNAKGDDGESATTGKVALRHFLDDGAGAMVYASISTGYKGLTYDISSSFTAADTEKPVDSEDSISYEIGIKGLAADGAFRYSLIAFLTDFENYQAQGAVVNEVGGVDFKLNNVGELRSQGIEADLSWQATDALRLDFSGAWIDATIESFPFANCYFGQGPAEGCNIDLDGDGVPDVQDLSGEELNNSPDFKFNVAAYWEQNLGSSFNWFATANYQWQDDVNYDLYGQPTNAQDAFGLANFSVGIIHPDGRYRASLFVNNAFDERYYLNIGDESDRRQDGQTQLTAIRPRESMRYAGIRFDYTF